MANIQEVSSFIRDFNAKVKVFGLIFRNGREKNVKALVDLEISPIKRRETVMSICPTDYVEGPLDDKLNKINKMWVFGKTVKGHDVYIKVSMGYENSSAICISFHIAEHPLRYKFK